jgi:glycosyltransferase involved in cell wall biosynthesis
VHAPEKHPQRLHQRDAPARLSAVRLLINFSTLKTGGGQNVALNFLYAAHSRPADDITCYYLVARNSEAHRYLRHDRSQPYIVAPRSALGRILFEFFLGWYFLTKHKIDIVYSYFGYALFPRRWPQVSGSADSYLYFPEVDFWRGYRGLVRLRKRIVDRYRIFGVKRGHAVVFETSLLEERARRIYGLKNTTTILPSIHISDQGLTFNLPGAVPPKAPRGLFLCGWHLNKNVMVIPDLAAELKRRQRAFTFILTAPPDGSAEHRQFSSMVRENNVADMVFITGPAQKAQLKSLYDQIDCVFLLSKLESFSNNIIEAWSYGKALVISDELWARSICQDAAVYVDRDSVVDIADRLITMLDSPTLIADKVDRGKAMLGNYPSIESRITQELDYIRNVLRTSQASHQEDSP